MIHTAPVRLVLNWWYSLSAALFFHPDTWEEHHAGIVSARAGNVIEEGFSEDRIIPDIIRALQAGHAVEVRNPASVRPWQHVLEPLAVTCYWAH